MLEVLIALVVLSVGLLGLAALQAEGLRSSSNAQNRFQAVRHASDIAARIRANEDAIDTNAAAGAALAYEIAKTASAAAGASNGCADVGSSTTSTVCTAAEMAAYDLFEWRRSLQESLPSGTGSVDITLGTNIITAEVVVEWSERGETLSITTEFQF